MGGSPALLGGLRNPDGFRAVKGTLNWAEKEALESMGNFLEHVCRKREEARRIWNS
jgi:hypothetical protein